MINYIIRSGSWFYYASDCIVTFRNYDDSETCFKVIGFRLAKKFKL